MAYRKLGRTNKHRRSMLANLTKAVIMNGKIETTETRAKEVRKFVDKMISYGKDGSLVARRKALAFVPFTTVMSSNNSVIIFPPDISCASITQSSNRKDTVLAGKVKVLTPLPALLNGYFFPSVV